MTKTSGWFVVMALAIFCSSIVFPVRGGETIRPRCPLPMGQNRLIEPCGDLLGGGLQVQDLVRVQGREVVEGNARLRHQRRIEVHRLHAQHREEPLALLRGADLPRNRVTRLQVEKADLRGGDVDVVRARKVAVVG